MCKAFNFNYILPYHILLNLSNLLYLTQLHFEPYIYLLKTNAFITKLAHHILQKKD